MKLVKNQTWFFEDRNSIISNCVSNKIYHTVLKTHGYAYSHYRFKTLDVVRGVISFNFLVRGDLENYTAY